LATVRETIERAREALIGGKADAALAPCMEVLAVYPRHLEATCLLAETRRELRQLPQAADLFERVVAADPESLIGHWGLATILEERGDVEAAAYELQAAWDVSPGQPAVADELRRLRGLLGWTTDDVDLTVAALARVYWRGHQYRRALSEARRALAAAPERLDLMVLECECLWRLGRVGEAAEVAAELLLESPDCLKANLIRGYARLETGSRAADEARKLLGRVLALDPECVVAATLFPDRALPPPLVKADVELDAAMPTLATPEPEPIHTPVSLLAAVEEPETVLAPIASAEPEATLVEPELAEPEPELLEPLPGPTPEPTPVPQWLVRDDAAPPEAPHGLDPELYAEWADLLGEEVDLDPDSVARLEAALSEATGGGGATGAWREVVLERDALAADQPTASEPARAASTPEPSPEQNQELAQAAALAEARATAALGDHDATAETYRQLLRAHASVAGEVVEELCRLVDGSPEHGGLRRALGDAYMRSGRFQKAIEEYNRAAAAVRQPAAVA
jgi:tetratricopeptide (TPR) repeat protein